MMEGLEKIQKDVDVKSEAILTKEQWSRLDEIRIHLLGPKAAMDPKIQEEIGIKASQKLEIKKLNDSLNQANMAIFMRMNENGIDREALQAELKQNDVILGQELAKILTDEQNAKIENMKGKPFKVDPNFQPQGMMFGSGGERRGGVRPIVAA